MGLNEFIQENFLNPIQYPQQYPPYNIFNTLAYAAIALIAVYIVYKLLKRLQIEIDEKFFYSIIPFAFLGSTLRVLVDANQLERNAFLVTPGIYVITFAATILALFIALFLQKKKAIDYANTMKAIGYILSFIALLALIPLFKQWFFAIAITALTIVGLLAFLAVNKLRGIQGNSMEKTLVLSQALDGSATFVGVQYAQYVGQHVVENLVFSSFGPGFFYLIKIAFAIFFIEVVRKELGQEVQGSTYVLLLATIFGLAPGARDFLRILAGV